jgi:hypothetical protein
VGQRRRQPVEKAVSQSNSDDCFTVLTFNTASRQLLNGSSQGIGEFFNGLRAYGNLQRRAKRSSLFSGNVAHPEVLVPLTMGY